MPIKVEIAPPKRKYIVRRLTPLECCRLQGFPDWWCEGLIDDKIDDNVLAFWREVFNTYCSINSIKPKSDRQIIKWLQTEPSESAIYKIWGNGVTLPCALDVMRGIVENDND